MRYILIAIISLLASCATNVTKEQWQKADFGENQGKKYYDTFIETSLKQVLIDPDSLKLSCEYPKKGWVKPMGFKPPQFGWVVYCAVNGRNSFGGYTGNKPYVYLFKGRYAILSNTYGNAIPGIDFQYMY